MLYLTHELFFLGTIDRYMAPEVFKHRKYDKKVDVFSFAMILYEVLIDLLVSLNVSFVGHDIFII